jgi:hypothetical protein
MNNLSGYRSSPLLHRGRSLAAFADLCNRTDATPACFTDGDTDQVDQFFVPKLTDTLHKVREMGTPILPGCLAINRGGRAVKEIELCLGACWHAYDVVREPRANKADI